MSGQFSGTRLRAAREDAGLSREQLAVAVTRAATTVASWECGRKIPHPDTIFAIARALGVKPQDLMEIPARRRHVAR